MLSLTINKHMYVAVSPRFENNTRVSYTDTEIADSVNSIQHSIVREAIHLTQPGRHVEITTIGDVPAGTGLGSSSTLSVGLVNALYALKGEISPAEDLARNACSIEIDILEKTIGRQDQYAAAYGGFNYIRFFPDDSVSVDPVPCATDVFEELQQNSLLIYTDKQRDAHTILERQSNDTENQMPVLRQMRDLAAEMCKAISGRGDLAEFARLLHDGWELKRSLGCGISEARFDEWYEAARRAGAQGGKILGAGGGGFMLFLAPPERHDKIREALGHPRELPFKADPHGSRIVFMSQRH